MKLTTRQIGSLWNYVIQNDLIAFQADWYLLSIDSSDAVIIEVRPEHRKPCRLKVEANGGVVELAEPALEQPISSEDRPEDGETAVSTLRRLEGPSSKEIADRARAGREALANGGGDQHGAAAIPGREME